ncbi:MAG TPA: hypothetical protein VIM11_07185 [Tepidisphaeraceae bacterium]|jgi:hypothetical protein
MTIPWPWVRRVALSGVITLNIGGATSRADAVGNTSNEADSGAPAGVSDKSADPIVPQRLVWPGIAVIIVIAIFVTAALTGPLIRANSSEDPPAENTPESSDETE